MASKNHTHKYTLVNLTKNKKKDPYWVYACALPGCQHNIRRDLIVGEECVCHRCGKKFTINKRIYYEKSVKPHCDACTKFKPETRDRRKRVNDVMEVLNLDEILNSLGDD